MPITPWHIGPGLAMKAAAGRRTSLGVFAVAQGMMDVEVVVRILTRTPPIHGYSTTLVGGAVIAAAAVGLTVPTMRVVQRLAGDRGRVWLTWWAAWAGAIVGTMSHVVLDSIMHRDVRPFWPMTDWSPIYQVIDNDALHALCFWSGAAGLIGWAMVWGWRKKAEKAGEGAGR